MKPADALRSILSEAYSSCKQARWDPLAGHVPRGFLGATGRPEDVEAVLSSRNRGFPTIGSATMIIYRRALCLRALPATSTQRSHTARISFIATLGAAFEAAGTCIQVDERSYPLG